MTKASRTEAHSEMKVTPMVADVRHLNGPSDRLVRGEQVSVQRDVTSAPTALDVRHAAPQMRAPFVVLGGHFGTRFSDSLENLGHPVLNGSTSAMPYDGLAFDDLMTLSLCLTTAVQQDGGMADPLRTILQQAGTVIVTLEHAEHWVDDESGLPVPYALVEASGDTVGFSRVEGRFTHLFDKLRECIASVSQLNPEATLLLALSPNHLGHRDCGAAGAFASFQDKATLRAVVTEFLQSGKEESGSVQYVPIYESAMEARGGDLLNGGLELGVPEIMSLLGDAWQVVEPLPASDQPSLQNSDEEQDEADSCHLSELIACHEKVQRAYDSLFISSPRAQMELLTEVVEELDGRTSLPSNLRGHAPYFAELLGHLFYEASRWNEAFSAYYRATQSITSRRPNWAKVLERFARLAVDLEHFEAVPEALELLIAHPSAGLHVFYDWIIALERMDGIEFAMTVLDDAAGRCPRMIRQKRYRKLKERYMSVLETDIIRPFQQAVPPDGHQLGAKAV